MQQQFAGYWYLIIMCYNVYALQSMDWRYDFVNDAALLV